MKTTRIYSMKNNILLFLIGSMMIFSLNSCATKMPFLSSTIVPGAEGFVKVNRDKNKNYVIKVQISNLADPSKLQSPKSTYIVWMEGDNNETKNIGKIKSSSDLLSKRLKGTLETVSPIKPRKVFISAENDASIEYANYSDVVLTTDNFRK